MFSRRRRRAAAGRRISWAASLLLLAAAPASAAPVPAAAPKAAQDAPALERFYAAGDAPLLWILRDPSGGGAPKPIARRLILDLERLEPADAELASEARRLEGLAAGRRPLPAGALSAFDRGLSAAVLRLARDEEDAASEYAYVDPGLRSQLPGAPLLLQALQVSPEAVAATLEMRNPLAAALLSAYWAAPPGRLEERRRLLLNYRRAEGLPRDLGARYVLVNIPAEELEMVQGGAVVGRMKVVVGKPDDQTPTLAALIRSAVARPYWNIPPDITARRIAPKVLTGGVGLLKTLGYEALADWSPNASVVDPQTIDWRGAAAGRVSVHLRQRPGPANMMGAVKFMFPNRFGVYLHDTPNRALFSGAQRADSHGCVRLADALGLARWLLGPRAAEVTGGGAPEAALELAPPVPVYIVYLTRAPDVRGMGAFPDVYGRDRSRARSSAPPEPAA